MMGRWMMAIVAALALSCSTGCVWLLVGAGAGAGAVAWARGELEAKTRSSLDESVKATVSSLGDIEYRVKEIKRTEVDAHIKALGSDDTEAKIELTRIDARETRIKIRFGTLGNEDYSRLLLEKIQRKLKK